ncbi:MAG: T9SS type A sorting domain-containing protein [Sphingomonadales bacterium]
MFFIGSFFELSAQYEGGSGRQEAVFTTSVLQLNNGVAATTSQLVITSGPASSTELSQDLNTLTFEYRTASGQVAYFETGDVSLSFQTNPGSSTLNGTTTQTPINGVATFTGLTVSATGSGYVLRGSGASGTSANSSAFDIYSIGAGGSGRNDAMADGADGLGTLSGEVFWVGGLGSSPTNWNDPLNWRPNMSVPGATARLVIEANGNGHNPVLDQNRTVSSVNFNGANKKVILGSNTLTLTSTVAGANANNYFQSTSNGMLRRNIPNGSSFTFPVGNTAYNPVIITNNTTAADVFSVRVMDEVYWKGTNGGITTTPRVKRTWVIDKTIPNAFDGNGVDLSFTWNTGEATAGLNTPRLYHFDGTQWQKQAAGNTVNSTNNLLYNGYKGTFSPFSIGDDVVLLPVTWLDFRCEASENNSTRLQWRTAMEQNTRAFIVERSADGQTYQSIGEVPAAGQSQTLRSYAFTDPQPLYSGSYYRVRMEDMDGNFSYSDVCNSKAKTAVNPVPLKVFPNPTDGGLYMIALEPERNFVWEVFSTTGQRIASGCSKEGKANARLHYLSEGVYQLRVVGSGLSENHRIVVKH